MGLSPSSFPPHPLPPPRYVKGSNDYKFRLACRYGHPRKMALLLKKGANVDAVSAVRACVCACACVCVCMCVYGVCVREGKEGRKGGG